MGVIALPWQQAAASAVLPAQPRPPPSNLTTTFPFLTVPRKRPPPTLMVVTEPTEGHRLAARPRLYRGRVLEQPHRTWAGTSSARPTSVTPPSDRMDTGRTRRGEEAEGAEEQWGQSQTVSLHRRSGSCHTHPPNHPLRAGLRSPLRHPPGPTSPAFRLPELVRARERVPTYQFTAECVLQKMSLEKGDGSVIDEWPATPAATAAATPTAKLATVTARRVITPVAMIMATEREEEGSGRRRGEKGGRREGARTRRGGVTSRLRETQSLADRRVCPSRVLGLSLATSAAPPTC